MLNDIQNKLQQYAIPVEKRKVVFFKTGPGEYAEHDQFLGVPTPRLKEVAKHYRNISLENIAELLYSPFNEIRLLALIILVERYQKSHPLIQEEAFQFYCSHMSQINNWNLVDASAHHIVGAHLFEKDKKILLELASSKILWERRIAIVSTWYFIRKNEFNWTLKIAEKLLGDDHDLIHKAVGWMLREVGKRDLDCLIEFLNQYVSQMPRITLRYAIEKLPHERRKEYLSR